MEKARLINKDKEACEDYYEELIAYAKKMCDDFPNPYIGLNRGRKPHARSAPSQDGSDGGSEEAGGAEDEYDEDAEQGDHDAAASYDDDDSKDRTTSLNNPYLISPIIAHRLLDRMKLWEELRHA